MDGGPRPRRITDRVRARATARRALLVALGVAALAGPALAHGGALAGGPRQTVHVPFWLFLMTSGGAVGASFILASFATDRAYVRYIHDWRGHLSVGDLRHLAVAVGRVVGVLALALVTVEAFVGPADADANVAVLATWVGWWAGLVVLTYLVGNAWPALSPWRALAAWLPKPTPRAYPEWLGAWPSVVALLGMIWLEVVSPATAEPRVLGAVVVGYTVVTLAGAVVFGPDAWFERADPIDRVFRFYGRVAPLRFTDEGLSVSVYGSRLLDPGLVRGADDVAFVVALLWVTTYDGLVSSPTGVAAARAVVGAGVPPRLAYLAALLCGFALFFGAYWLAAPIARRTAPTYLSVADLRYRFAPALVPVAAGYHLAHYLAYALSFAPTLGAAFLHVLGVSAPATVLVLPAAVGVLSLASVLVGHWVGVWLAHATAFESLPGRLQAVRSQYPFVAVMIAYTLVSMWVVSRPSLPLPYLG